MSKMSNRKICIKCKMEKSIKEFNKNQNVCKECSKEYYKSNKENTNEKSKPVGIRFTIDELELIDERAAQIGLERSKYLKKIILENLSKVVIKIDFNSLDNLAYEINKIGVNINQIAHIANSEKHIYKSDIEYLREKQERIEDMLCKYYDVVLRLQRKIR